MNDRLYRSRTERMLGGVCGGLGLRFDIDPSLVRVGWALLTIFTGGAFLLIYIVLLFIVPEEPEGYRRVPGPPWAPGPTGPPAPGAVAGWTAPGSSTTGGTEGTTPPGDPNAMWGATAGWAAMPHPDPAAEAARAAERRRRDNTLAFAFGLLFIALGGFFLLRELLPPFDFGRWWPVIAIVIGVLLLVRSVRFDRGRS